jgi:outer membrane immunogenic protein
MKMKIKLLVAAVVTVLASSAMAQSAFQGFYGQVGTGYETNSITSVSTSINGTGAGSGDTSRNSASFANQTASGMPAVIGLGFNYPITKDFLLGLGADYSLTSQKTSNATSGVLVSTPASSGSYIIANQQTEISNRTNIFLTPGYAIDKDKLVYLKAGYSQQQLKYTWPTQSGTGNQTNLNAMSASKNVTGYVLGLGYKQIITGGLYGFGEANYYSYGNANISSNVSSSSGNTYTVSAPLGSSAYTVLVGVGYKF